MGSQEITHNPGYYISLGVGALAMVVLLALVIVGIVVAIRAKTGTGKGCGIVMAIAFVLQAGLVAFWLLITIVSGFEPSSSQRRGQTRMVEANDGSCEISVPASWADAPDLSKEAVLGAKDLTGNEYVIVFVHSKEDYTGGLDEFAKDHTDLLREKLMAPKVEAPASISVNGKTAVRQIVRGEIDRLRVTYRITYFEGKNNFYRVFCWSLESKAPWFAGDLDKVAESFREKVVAQDADHS
jgi:hypothetical protein